MEQPQSSEEIVQSLRDMAFIIDESQGAAVVAMLSGDMFNEAADEIERLRDAGDALHAAIRHHDLHEAHLRTWEEARRG